MEERVLYNVLRNLNSNAAPDREYMKSLENVGIIKNEWEGYCLTSLGSTIYSSLQDKFEKW